MNPTTLIIIITVLLVVGSIAFMLVDKFLKSTPKPKAEEPKPKETKPEAVSMDENIPLKPEKPVEPEETIEINNNPKSEFVSQRGRIAEYHKKRWADRHHIDRPGTLDPDEQSLSQEEVAKLIALRDLFDKK